MGAPAIFIRIVRVHDRLEYERDLGFLLSTARAAQLLLPVLKRQQYLFSPLGPLRGHSHLRQVLTHSLPPTIDQGRNASELLTDLVQGGFLPRQPVRLQSCFDRLELGSQLLLNLLGRLAGRVRQPPGMEDA